MGRRTKWQQFDICQLVLDIQTKSVEVKKLRDMVPDKGVEGEDHTSYVKQDEESSLWAQPVLTEAEEKEEHKEDTKNLKKLETHELLLADQIVIQAYVNYLFCSQPAGDEIAFELIRAYVNGCIVKS